MMIGTYLEVIGCLGAALVVILGLVEIWISKLGWFCDGFVMILETELTLVLVNVKGWGGGGGGGGSGAMREPMDSNRSFSVMSTLRIVLEALEIFRHMRKSGRAQMLPPEKLA